MTRPGPPPFPLTPAEAEGMRQIAGADGLADWESDRDAGWRFGPLSIVQAERLLDWAEERGIGGLAPYLDDDGWYLRYAD